MALPTPEQLAKSGTEHGHQVALMSWCATSGIPELRWLFSVPNGGARDGITASNLKAEGVRSGVFDLCLPVARGAYHGLYIELKTPKRRTKKHGGMSDTQMAFADFVKEQGYAAITCYGWEHASRVLQAYMQLGAYSYT